MVTLAGLLPLTDLEHQTLIPSMTYIIEIATSDFRTTQAAIAGGADRIELCANLVEGGTTPSHGTILRCRELFSTELYPIIRPRGGDFLYTDDEFEIMKSDIRFCKQIECDGVVIGMLCEDGCIDVARTAELIELADPLGVTFHRAFDRCFDPFASLEQLIQIGCDRLLTSGQQPNAIDGVDLIGELNRLAQDRITVMPGSGVRKENIKELAKRTGCSQFHASLRDYEQSGMKFVHPAFANSSESYKNNAIFSEEVMELRCALNCLEAG